MTPTRSDIFKHLKFSENVNFEGTNSVESILAVVGFHPVNVSACCELGIPPVIIEHDPSGFPFKSLKNFREHMPLP